MQVKTILGVKCVVLEQKEVDFINNELILQAFKELKAALGEKSETKAIYLNALEGYLSEVGEVCDFKDYLLFLENNRALCNLGCCFFDYADCKGKDWAFCLEFLKALNPPWINAQPLMAKEYAQRVARKIKAIESLAH